MVIALIIMCITITNTVSGKLYKNRESELEKRATIISDCAALNFDDTGYLKDFLEINLNNTGIRCVITNSISEVIIDSNTFAKAEDFVIISDIVTSAIRGEVTSSTSENSNGVKTLSVAAPIINDGIVDGAVLLSESTDNIDNAVKSVRTGLIIFSVVILLLVILLSFRMGHMVTSPLNDFITTVQEISKGNFDKNIPVKGNSEIDQLANAINYMSTELEHLEGKRRKFVSDASHELKTPMATIKLICDSITATPDPDPGMVQEFLADLSDEVDRLTRIIEKLLLLTKLDSKETNLTPELVDVGMMLQRIKTNLTPLAAGKNITITSDVQADMPPVTLDYDRIWEAMYNLVDNAIKYSKIGGTVKITASVSEELLKICIYDSGKGIPDEFKERIFERFYRLDDSRTRETGGTGLGLAIAREAVILHGGKLYAEDNPEGGSCFVMTLPAGNTAPAPRNGGEEE